MTVSWPAPNVCTDFMYNCDYKYNKHGMVGWVADLVWNAECVTDSALPVTNGFKMAGPQNVLMHQ